ncbi:MAG: bile acid:sodium symporter family protein [Bacteroidota bacterium]
MCKEIDAVVLNFSSTGLLLLDITLAIIMLGVALSIRIDDFRQLMYHPKAAFVGLSSQLILLPALTFLFVWILEPCPGIALGMFLVAACPGGNVSNFISQQARANTALSVSLSAVSTLLALIVTPLNFALWAGMYEPVGDRLREISLQPMDILVKVSLILGLPLLLGMWIRHRFPKTADKMEQPFRWVSIVIFAIYLGVAFINNLDNFIQYVGEVFFIVLIHNGLAVGGGYTWASIFRLPQQDRRTVAIETGIQNSGLALVLIFSGIFQNVGGMAMIAAFWGIWHIVSGFSIAAIWGRQPIVSPE